MIRARVFVRCEWRIEEDEGPVEENWGEFEFAELPRLGEVINVIHDYDDHELLVVRVVHFPVPHPRPESEFPSLERTEPVMHLITKLWVF